MSASLRGKRLPQFVGLVIAMIGLIFASSTSAAPPLDTVNVTGGDGGVRDINITAQSGTSGENPSGSVSISILLPDPVTEQFVFTPISGPVTCLGVTGPDQGAGTPEEPTTATLNFDATSVFSSGQTVHIGILTAQFVDKGGNGQDTFAGAPAGSREPTDCSPVPGEGTPLTNGRAIVFDAPSLPTSKDQCKNGGWRDFPQFKNQGDCISFVTDRH